MIGKKEYTKKEIVAEVKNLNEKQNLTEIDADLILMGLGFIPVIGEVFDVILIVKFFVQKRWIEAFLMMVALIPTVGDIAVKPLLLMGRGLKAFTSTAKFANVLKTSPKFAKLYERASKYFGSPQVTKLSEQIIKKHPDLASDIAKAKAFHINMAGKIKVGPATTLIRGAERKGLGFRTTQAFRTSAVNKYFNKFGKLPPDGFASWYNVVYKARTARRAAFRKALLASGLLGVLGLPNIESFERFISTPGGAETAANTPEFQDLYTQTTSQNDEELINQQLESSGSQQTGDEGGGSGILRFLSISLLKRLAGAAIL